MLLHSGDNGSPGARDTAPTGQRLFARLPAPDKDFCVIEDRASMIVLHHLNDNDIEREAANRGRLLLH